MKAEYDLDFVSGSFGVAFRLVRKRIASAFSVQRVEICLRDPCSSVYCMMYELERFLLKIETLFMTHS